MNQLQQQPHAICSTNDVDAEKAKRKHNTVLWRMVTTPDPLYTKTVNQRGGYTAIDPMYQARMATEQFGAFGQGWGLEESTLDCALVELTGMVIHKATFFYHLNGERGAFPLHNAISIWSDGKRTRPDEDFAKKVETNSISKALSRLGFCADVFMGKFDNLNYVNQIASEKTVEREVQEIEEQDTAKHDYSIWMEGELDKIRTALTANEATKIGTSLKPRASAKGMRFGYPAKKIAERIDAIIQTRIDDLAQ